MNFDIEFSADRAVKARLARSLNGLPIRLLTVLTVTLGVSGAIIGVLASSFGWLLLGCAVLPAMLVEWYNGELALLKASAKPQSVGDILNSKILGSLPKQPSPKQIASAVSEQSSGLFYAARFGITPNLLQHISSDDQGSSRQIWESATAIRDKLDAKEITAGMIIFGIISQFDEHEKLLAQLHIEMSDIEEGIRWQARLMGIIDSSHQPRRTGGLARDWSFGYVPLLNRFGQNISEQVARGGLYGVELDGHTEALNQLLRSFSSGGRQNATLVGSAGVGKSTIVHSFAEKLLDASSQISSELKFRQVYLLDSSALISAAPGRGELEGLVTRVLSEAFAAKNIIICLDDAQLFFEEGIGSVDLTNVLLPILEAGRLRIILTMEEQRLLQISQRNPALINALNRIVISPASETESLKVMQNQLLSLEFRNKVTYTYQSLKEAYRLSERYIHDLAMPGRAVKLLESSASYAQDGLVTINSVQQAIEKTMDVKVSVASESDDRDKLLNLESLIHKRMINQTRAVGAVSDALRRARAGVRNQDRPIGTFLFLGPTGVGKTELAKALADVYFGGEERMVRLDLNEYVQAQDVSRLIADGANDSASLTAQMLKQPFSVVLLDEIEKAHPSVLTALLQVLDEGILRDINNREVSFRDAIVVATSNAGADRIRELVMRGQNPSQFEAQFLDELISTGQFRPEFINRFDEVVTFTPLTKIDLLKVVDLMIAGVNKTLASQKISVSVSDEAKLLLVERGYDPRLGARPMRRVVQKAVENTVAKAVLGGVAQAGGTVSIDEEQVRSMLDSAYQASSIAENLSTEYTEE